MKIRIHRTDGKTGHYTQDDPRRVAMLLQRFDPKRLFRSGPIVIGTLNPFSILNPDEICWIEVESEQDAALLNPKGIEQVQRLTGRDEYEKLLAQQWPRWRANNHHKPGDLLEALVELSFRDGGALYLRAMGYVTEASLVDMVFAAPAITATFAPHGTVYINPKCVVRARVYHSKAEVNYPDGIWVAEADDI
jgi:hypothetical protein